MIDSSLAESRRAGTGLLSGVQFDGYSPRSSDSGSLLSARVRWAGHRQTGPLAQEPGHDIKYLGLAGALGVMGQPGEPPPVPLNLVDDMSGDAELRMAGMELNFIEYHGDGTTAIVWLNRPPVNAATLDVYLEITELFGNISTYLPGARAVLLAARGKHFCAGNDLAEFESMNPENAPGRMKIAREAFWAIYDAPMPVIAAVQGAAVGAGLGFAASCDLIVAADNAKFGLPEINVGVMGGAKHLSRLVPQGMVRQMYYTGELVEAQKLAAFGGIVDIVAAADLHDAALALARSIARHSPVALRFAKQNLNAVEYEELKAGYEFEQGRTAELSGYADSKEAVRAYLEGRDPVYTGR